MLKENNDYQIQAIGHIKSPFKEKFGLPRQSNLIASLKTEIVIHESYSQNDAFEGIEDFSHLWVQGMFHEHIGKPWKTKVRPPRLGGNKSRGVFATRASFRPNHLSLSVVELISVQRKKKEIVLETSCIDMIDGTPIFDIKPYIPYSDAVTDAYSHFAPEPPQTRLSIDIASNAENSISIHATRLKEEKLKSIITEVLSLDPRPAYQKNQPTRVYKMRLYDFDLHFSVDDETSVCTVLEARS